MSNKYKRKGRAKFLMLEGYLLRSAAWRAATPVDRSLYLELKWRYDGLNNGRIGLSCREAAEALGVSKATADRSFKHLQELGFVEIAKRSGFNVKSRVSTEWLLTEHKDDRTGDLPKKTFTRWAPEIQNTVSPEGHIVSSEVQWRPKNVAICA